jgi:proteasome activator subunit 4
MDGVNGARDKLADLLASLTGQNGNDVSRATSSGGESRESNKTQNNDEYKKTRNRSRTYPYFKCLPYDVEHEAERQRNLDEILKQLYIAVNAGDFTPGAVHWTRELEEWLNLKFNPTKEQRIKLVKLYYELSLAPGIDPVVAERFSSTFMQLTK